jgi:hypothetical protein
MMLQYKKERGVGRLFLLFGSVCLIIVVLTHVAETFHIFQSIGAPQDNVRSHHRANEASALISLIPAKACPQICGYEGPAMPNKVVYPETKSGPRS